MIALGQFEDDAVLDRAAERVDRNVGAVRGVEEVGETGVADGDQIKALVLAEEAFGDAEGLFLADENADVRLESHFGESDSEAAGGDGVEGRDAGGDDGAAEDGKKGSKGKRGGGGEREGGRRR